MSHRYRYMYRYMYLYGCGYRYGYGYMYRYRYGCIRILLLHLSRPTAWAFPVLHCRNRYHLCA